MEKSIAITDLLKAEEGNVFNHTYAHNIKFFDQLGVMLYCLNGIVPIIVNDHLS